MAINEWDSTDPGIDYGLPDFSSGAGASDGSGGNSFNLSIPSGVNISLGGGPIVNTPSVPQYPATAPAIYQRGPYTNTAIVSGGMPGQSMLLWVIIGAAILYVVLAK